MDLFDIDHFGRHHHGLITADHAARLGLTTAQWNHLNMGDDRLLERLFPRVSRVFGAPTSAVQRIGAAVLAAGPGAMGSHRSATTVWGAERPSTDPVDIILPSRTRRARLDGVVVHRPSDLDDLRPVVRLGVPVTNPLRVLIDLGAVDPGGVADALKHFVLAGLVTPVAVAAALERHAVRGRSGVRPLRRALERWMLDGKPSDSDLENQMAVVAARHELAPMEFHAHVGGYEVDFLVVGTPIIVECDGWSTHGVDKRQFHRDRDKDAELHASGFIVQRVTSAQLFVRPTKAAEQIARCVWAWAPSVANAHLANHPFSILGATKPR